jgi:CIC family chloride channel protein
MSKFRWAMPKIRWTSWFRSDSAGIEWRENQLFLLLTLTIGALTGLSVVAFIVLTERLGMRLYPVGSAPWRRFMIPVVGSLIIGYLLAKYFPDARGSGVPQTKAALFARGGVITFSTMLGKFFCTAATLASGIPLGREGPSVQVGGGIASVLGRHLGLPQEKVKALIPAAAAAAIAAAFNTPMAAVLFALEEIMGDMRAPVLGSVVLASATSWVVLQLLLGNQPLFQVPQYQLVNPIEFAIYAILGIVGGLVSAAFTSLLLGIRKRFLQFPSRSAWIQPVVGGLLVGLMGLFVPQVLGVGYGYVGDALNGRMTLTLMAMLVVLKLVGAATCYGTGNAGGIFGPALFIGAMLGGTVGGIAHHFLPTYTATSGAYALVGMGTAFAGIVRAPMTSVLMIFETTRDYTVIVPLMISNLVSYLISSRLQKDPIYTALAWQDGVHLPDAENNTQNEERRVFKIARPVMEVLQGNLSVDDALKQISGSSQHTWPVVDDRGVIGVLSRSMIASAATSEQEPGQIGDLVKGHEFPHVHMDHPLHLALDRMGSTGLDLLPIVSRANINDILGVVTLDDLLTSFHIDRVKNSAAP